jgi:hypothetical protein
LALVLLFPAAPGPIGPGYYWQVQQTVGPVAAGDTFTLTINDGAGSFLTTGRVVDDSGSAFPFGVVGVRPALVYGISLIGKVSQAAAGAAVALQVVQRHSNGAFVASVAPAGGWTWDPTGGLSELAVAIGSSGAGIGALSTAYKNAP